MSQSKKNASNNKPPIHSDNDRMTNRDHTTPQLPATPRPVKPQKRETIFNNNRVTGFNRVRIKTLAHTSLWIFNHPSDAFDVAYLRRILVMYGMLREERTPGLSDHDIRRCASYFSSQLGLKRNKAIATLLESRPLVEAVTLQAICELELAQYSKKQSTVKSSIRDEPAGAGVDAVMNDFEAVLNERIGEGHLLQDGRSNVVVREDGAGDGIEESLNANTSVVTTGSVDKSEPASTEVKECALDLSDPENYPLSDPEKYALPDPDDYALSDSEDYALSDAENDSDEHNGIGGATAVKNEDESESDDEIEDYQTENSRVTKFGPLADNGFTFVTHRSINMEVREIKKDLGEIRGMMKKVNANFERIESFL